MNKREFIKRSAVSSLALGTVFVNNSCANGQDESTEKTIKGQKPLVISTWNNVEANQVAWDVLAKGGSSLDAVEAGVKIPEANPNDRSVGYGGNPDRDGNVTLDSCIMNHDSNCGSVAFVQNYKHPISIARLVMEKTPHVMMVGKGAEKLARDNGFIAENLLTEKSKEAWEKWLEKGEYMPEINVENHDTIGMVALDQSGKLAGACTTSGAAYKMQGRVGDSPIIGAGLFVDGDVGAATATGLGEAVIKVAGTHLVVEFMRQGLSPEEACKAAVERVIKKEPNYKDLQVGFCAINIHGEYGGYSIHKGFSFALNYADEKTIIKASHAI